MKTIRYLILLAIFTFLWTGVMWLVFAEDPIDGGYLNTVVIQWKAPQNNIPNINVSSPNINIDTSKLKNLGKKNDKNTNNKEDCKWIKLNTNVPFIGNCISTQNTDGNATNQINAFPKLMKSLMKLVMLVIMVMSVLMIVAAGVLMTTGGYDKGNYSKGMEIIMKVVKWIALLWASGVILKLINPNFFN